MTGQADRAPATERGYTVEELWQIARRRARSSSIVFGACLAVGLVVAFATPGEHRAEVAIVLEPYRPHVELVTPAVTTLLEDRLRVARQQLLAGPRLEAVVRSTGVFASTESERGIEAAVDLLRARLEVKPDGDAAILLGFRAKDPELAAKVVRAVASGFVAANAEMRIGQARRVVDAIVDELGRVTKSLDEREGQVRAFRVAHDGELPEQVESNLREAERATHLLSSSQGWLRDVERRRSELPVQGTTPEVQRLTLVEADLVRQLNHARALFSEDHPEPVRLARELEGVRSLLSEATARADTLQRDRTAIDRDWKRARAEVAGLERSAQSAKERASAAARWAGELAVLERDRDLLREKYRSLTSRRVEAEVSMSLEERAAPVATRVVEPGGRAATPVGPDRMRLASIALLLSLGLAIAWAAFLESRDFSLRNASEARARLPVPLLAVVPDLRSRS